MLRLLHATVLGLVGAGIVHVAVLLLVPQFSERDAWSRLAMAADLYKVVRFDTQRGEAAAVKSGDPLFYAAACRFDLNDGVVHIRSAGRPPFWSVSVYNRAGQNIFSFNDRAATDGTLDFVVATPSQVVEIRKDVIDDYKKSIFVETELAEGIIVVRSFVPDDSWDQAVSGFLDTMSCTSR
ncbi:DUF1254 domain-containing protein [Pseudaminobacter arsenicus]|uniref:DUF1254 domain-containing protein n=1 Tax=Borborobacter arsenicus TaxID=1851146 RepID=A0A432V5D7_9HYPH|nr:DUF1254 domain-containing protein [Pseudaminobacter arsenicus]RUM97349.1 DUF1254 domain-containing protein [Pseudaminobacter arsenicus]